MVGAAFAVSSLRALTMLAPFGSRTGAASLPTLVLLIAVFALGILLSMSLFGVAFARLMSARTMQRLGRAPLPSLPLPRRWAGRVLDRRELIAAEPRLKAACYCNPAASEASRE